MFTIEEILAATQGRLIQGDKNCRVLGVSIDSRSLKAKELFVAIKGPRFDGHHFIQQAQVQGASAILVSHQVALGQAVTTGAKNPLTAIKVKDTVLALEKLAHFHRMRFKIPLVAITGSNGKTTTKEMLTQILRRGFQVLSNPRTENNHIGVALAILRLRKKHELAVIEIGANHFGEIDRLAEIIQPTVGVMTNIGPAHLEFFKTLQGVLRAKLELVRHLTKPAKLIINQDDRFLSGLNGVGLKKITYGLVRPADFWAEAIEETGEGITFLLNQRYPIKLKVLGRHNLYNALASIACARSLGVGFQRIKQALADFPGLPMRMQQINMNRVKVIDDCYNANPESFERALDFLKQYSVSGKKILVCGDMLELGKASSRLHLNLGKKVAQSKIDFLITAGSLARKVAAGAKFSGMSKNSIYVCSNTQEAAQVLRKFVQPQDVVLIKGSRGMKMENMLSCFTSSFIR
ncbi:MAG: UDP-N-acetylmuramoyl-tripeptide--D-alanyl-D-alanine ligase [Candidatus Omnitrophica bacterium]|nr:UDP-N-acetylmuramoyl-tripeptide--D-alanyl-D-alanine ligase [Candidatus Omnitrophota bacterium]